ncbi:MAG: alpha/beta fold hydrolase [Cyanobacteria bacterium P01_A01_bin.135]
MARLLSNFWKTVLSAACLATAGALGEITQPKSAAGAEVVQVVVEGPLTLTLSVDDLEAFAETGEASGDVALVVGFLPDQVRGTVQQQLRQPIPFNRATVGNLTYSPLGRELLSNLGKVIRVHPDVDGFYGLRAALIGAAAAGSNNWTLLDVLRQFPSEDIYIKLEDLLKLRQTLTGYLDYNQAVVSAIQQQATLEAEADASGPIADELTRLSEPGSYAVGTTSITVENPDLRQTDTGLTVSYDFPVDVYYPQGLTEPAPVLLLSHGFGDVKESFVFMAEHLASHGTAVMLIDHIGSDLSYRQTFLQGRLNTLLSPMEFLNRPQEISFLIDDLERLVARSPEWSARLDLSRIAVMGDSLGGSTALALAGAEINYLRLAAACHEENVILNIALYLQCRAQHLPPENYQLRDDRISAVVVTHPMGGHLYGPEGMAQVAIPLLMISGSNDILSPVVPEQIYPFIWAQSSPKYLALMQVGTHFTSKPGRVNAEGMFQALVGEHRDIGARYAKGLVLAFLQNHLVRDDEARRPELARLTAAAGRALSADEPLRLDIIQSLTAEQLEAAYGASLPIPIDPPAIAPETPPRDESILAEIERTGVLKVAFRKDAPPFGYINQDTAWDGYCGEMAIALGNYLTNALDSPTRVELVELTSTLQNRFDLVRDGSVHLECGPNTIRTDIADITFSQSILTASTRFLISSSKADTVNPNLPLADTRLGVLQDTTAETLVRDRYPQATLIPFRGADGRQTAVQAVSSGQIDAFVGDGILSYAELIREGQDISNFTLVPERPLSCEFYGLILPDNDSTWKATVDTFLESDAENMVFDDWFGGVFSFNLQVTDYCLNQR